MDNRSDQQPEEDADHQARSIFFLTSHDADAALLGAVADRLPEGFPAIDLVTAGTAANPALQEAVLAKAAHAGAVMIRVMGGKESVGAPFEQMVELWEERGVPVISQRSYPMENDDMAQYTTAPPGSARPALELLLAGGADNFTSLLTYLSDTFLGTDFGFEEPQQLPWEGVYHPDLPGTPTVGELIEQRWKEGQPAIGMLFYRSQLLGGDTAVVDALVRELESRGANVLPLFVYGLRATLDQHDGTAAVCELLSGPDGRPLVDCLITMLSFSVATASPNGGALDDPPGLGQLGIPVLQGMQSLTTRAAWRENPAGFGAVDISISIALPELDGRIITAPTAFKEPPDVDPGTLATRPQPHSFEPDRIAALAGQALRWARLRRLPNGEKRVAIVLNNPNGSDSFVGAAFGLDAAESIVRLLHALADAGFLVEEIPADGDELVHRMIDRCPNTIHSVTEAQLAGAVGHVPTDTYTAWFDDIDAGARKAVNEQWGPPPGEPFRIGDRIAVPGIMLGNVFVGPQPQRGFGLDPDAIYHSPDLPPAHQYLAFHRWLHDDFKADALIDMGKHGNLEWLPGKGVALSSACFPDLVLGDMPFIYPYVINNPGEGTQAKRRAHAVIVDHLTPPVANAGSYGATAEIERLTAEYTEATSLDERRLPVLRDQIWAAICEANLQADLGIEVRPEDEAFSELLHGLSHLLSELRDAQITTGLHILGEAPEGEQLVETLSAMLRLPSGEAPALHASLASALGLDWEELLADRGTPTTATLPAALSESAAHPLHTNGDVIDAVETLARELLGTVGAYEGDGDPVDAVAARYPYAGDAAVRGALEFAAQRLLPALAQTTDEIGSVIAALEGRAVRPGPSGAPTRGQAEVLPTGRNFYSMDPRAMPSRSAWEVGKRLSNVLIKKHMEDDGVYPESVAVIIWGTANMRTRGEDIAQVLYLLGTEPCWDPASGRVSSVRAIPLEELGRPRIDAIARVSGFFRDSFPNVMHLIDEAVTLVAGLDEPPEQNFVRKHVEEERAAGHDTTGALYRVFAPKPGAYVDGVAQLIDQRNWESRRDIAEVYATWVSHAYTRNEYGTAAREQFVRRAGELDVVVKNRDNQEHDVFDTDDYFQDFGAMAAVARELGGAETKAWVGDSTRPSTPAIRDAGDEARRTFRRRAMNPRWIEGMKRHGYKGGSELLKTVSYAFGYDATMGVVEDWMYEGFAERYLLDADTQEFLREHNPWAMRDMSERLIEAMDRGLWKEPPDGMREQLEHLILEADGEIEGRQEPVTHGGDAI